MTNSAVLNHESPRNGLGFYVENVFDLHIQLGFAQARNCAWWG